MIEPRSVPELLMAPIPDAPTGKKQARETRNAVGANGGLPLQHLGWRLVNYLN